MVAWNGIPDAVKRRLLQEHRECAICGGSKRLGVDHCHVSGRVRGVLCHKCNVAIGLFDDDEDLMRAAAEYVERQDWYWRNGFFDLTGVISRPRAQRPVGRGER